MLALAVLSGIVAGMKASSPSKVDSDVALFFAAAASVMAVLSMAVTIGFIKVAPRLGLTVTKPSWRLSLFRTDHITTQVSFLAAFVLSSTLSFTLVRVIVGDMVSAVIVATVAVANTAGAIVGVVYAARRLPKIDMCDLGTKLPILHDLHMVRGITAYKKIILIIAISGLLIGVCWIFNNWYFLRRAVYVDAQVVRVETHRDGSSSPILRFQSVGSNSQIEVMYNWKSRPSRWDVGNTMKVAYLPNHPKDYVIVSTSDIWLLPLILIVANVALIVVIHVLSRKGAENEWAENNM